MTQTEIRNLRAILEARQSEWAPSLRKRDGIEIERRLIHWTTCDSPRNVS